MFCPKCKYEYREGFSECSDCKIPLVDQLVPESPQEYYSFKEVTSNLRQDEIGIIKSILDANEIVYSIQGESFGTMAKTSGAIRLVVQENQYEVALELLKDFM